LTTLFRLTRRHLLLATGSAVTLGAASLSAQTPSASEPFPNRPIRFIVPFPAGGTSDFRARQVAERLRQDAGWQVVVDNRPGASGMIGSEAVAKASPDGYTLLLGTIGVLAINPHLLPNQPYQVARDFQPITQFSRSHTLLCAHRSSGIRSLADLEAQARGGARLAYASTGNATIGHMVMEAYKRRAGLVAGRDITHVPYRGSAPALQDFIGGQVPLHLDTPTATWEHLRSGVAVPIAISSAQRPAQLPQAPTFVEQGYPGFVFDTWQGVLTTRGVPAPVLETLHREFARALRQPEVVRSHEDQVNAVVANTPAEFERFIVAESQRWAQVIAETGIKLDQA
jgi:tripartite-type tricarboxylate transporter receptor subunit TctC